MHWYVGQQVIQPRTQSQWKLVKMLWTIFWWILLIPLQIWAQLWCYHADTMVMSRIVFPMGPKGTGYIKSAFKPHRKCRKAGVAEDVHLEGWSGHFFSIWRCKHCKPAKATQGSSTGTAAIELNWQYNYNTHTTITLKQKIYIKIRWLVYLVYFDASKQASKKSFKLLYMDHPPYKENHLQILCRLSHLEGSFQWLGAACCFGSSADWPFGHLFM